MRFLAASILVSDVANLAVFGWRACTGRATDLPERFAKVVAVYQTVAMTALAVRVLRNG